MNEDAITSMVFTPLLFMPTASAFAVMSAVAGPAMGVAIGDRIPDSHDLRFWPSGLRAARATDGRPTRCEPDFVLCFGFPLGAPVVIVGEMKWDWRIGPGDLKDEVARQREAIAAELPRAKQLTLVITKFRLKERLADTTHKTWTEVHDAASKLASASVGTPHQRWGSLVAAFLKEAEQIAFQGFNEADFARVTSARPIFWRQADG